MKKLYGIGVGPGDAEYLTIKAYKAIKGASAIFVPDRMGESTALLIVKDYVDEKKIVPISIVMGENNDIRYSKAAKVIEETLMDGDTGVFLTLGDPMVYSTFLYLMRELEKIKVHVEAIPGISSFTAAASKVKMPIAMKGEGFYLCDGSIDEEILKKCSSVAILKTYKNKKDILDTLEKYEFQYVYVKCCGRSDEKILYDKEEILEDKSYMSLLLGRRKNND